MFEVNGNKFEFFWQADCFAQRLRNAGSAVSIKLNGVELSSAEISELCFDLED